MFPYVPPFGLSLIYLSLLKAKTEAKEENGWRGTKCLVFLKRGDDSNFPFSWLFKLRLFSASELRLPCFWWWSPPFNSSRFSRIRLPPPSLYVCTMISTTSKKTRASIHGKSCCNLLQRLMGVDCARGLWLVAALNESHDSRVPKEQHIKSFFYDNANGLVISIFMRISSKISGKIWIMLQLHDHVTRRTFFSILF